MKTNNFENKESVYLEAEKNANVFNVFAMLFLAFLSLIAEILNEFGLFTIERRVMIPIVCILSFLFLFPGLLVLIHDVLLKKEQKIVSSHYMRYLLIIFSYLGITLLCIALSYHAILLMVIPPLMSAQYPYEKKMSISILIVTIVLVPVAAYGSFFLGLPDRNFIKNIMTDEEMKSIANRFNISGKRLFEIFFHHILPRMMCIVSIDFLIIGISSRNKKMLDRTNDLSNEVQSEMQQRNAMQSKVIEDLAAVIETRDTSTGEHVVRTKYYVNIIAKELQKRDKYKEILTDDVIDKIIESAPLHDVGKIAVSDQILLKPAKLSDEEFNTMKYHTTKGGLMIKTIFKNLDDNGFIDKAYEIALYHHEKWNGNGYPSGLKGEEIPIAARIMAIADVYDALVSKRVYKDPISHEEAFDMLVSEAGSHFDPDIIDAVVAIKDKFINY